MKGLFLFYIPYNSFQKRASYLDKNPIIFFLFKKKLEPWPVWLSDWSVGCAQKGCRFNPQSFWDQSTCLTHINDSLPLTLPLPFPLPLSLPLLFAGGTGGPLRSSHS